MRMPHYTIAAASLAGVGAGALVALRWTRVVSLAQIRTITASTDAQISSIATVAIALLLTAGILWWKGCRPARRPMIAAVLSTIVALTVCAALGSVSRALDNAEPGLWRLVLTAALLPAGLSVLARRYWLAAAWLTAALGLAPAAHLQLTALGDPIAQAAATYQVPPLAVSFVEGATSLLFLAGIIALCHSALTRGPVQPTLAKTLAVATTVAVIAWAANTLAFFVVTTSGHAVIPTYAAIIPAWLFLAATMSMAWRAWSVPNGLRSRRWAPLAPALAIGAISLTAAHGTTEYQCLRRYHSDVTHTYIHFSADGTWRRTIDDSGSLAKLQACERFLSSYPHSAYRPAVVITLAECQFELWDFSAASHTLARLYSDYPRLGGYADLLAALSHFAAGRPEQLLRPTDENSALGLWRRTRGALLTGLAAERTGHPRRALGFYNTYMEYMHAQAATSWSPQTLQFASNRADDALRSMDTPATLLKRGTVRIRVVAGADPISGARVALVQPHIDAALPADSMQFSGAWSLPAWNGNWGVSDDHGIATIRNVPYGTYEVVVGFSLKTCRRGFVIADPVPPVTVSGAMNTPNRLTLVPAVKLRAPLVGTLGQDKRLTWQAYPGAAHYSVSVVIVDEPRRSRHAAPGITCWACSRIPDTSVTLDQTHLVGGHSGLQKGGSYMWIVYAYDSAGKLLSSSEHYYQLHEPVFTLQ